MSEFKTQVASDIVRDGLGVELVDPLGKVVAEVFRCDKDHTVIVSTFGNDVPIQAMQQLFDRALEKLDPFEDGTPLSRAKICPARRSFLE